MSIEIHACLHDHVCMQSAVTVTSFSSYIYKVGYVYVYLTRARIVYAVRCEGCLQVVYRIMRLGGREEHAH